MLVRMQPMFLTVVSMASLVSKLDRLLAFAAVALDDKIFGLLEENSI